MFVAGKQNEWIRHSSKDLKVRTGTKKDMFLEDFAFKWSFYVLKHIQKDDISIRHACETKGYFFLDGFVLNRIL